MYVVCVTIYIKPDHVQDFIQAILANASSTRQEPGNLRFDVLQAEDDPTRFFLYEVYRSKDDFATHQQTDHYFTWRDAVQSWMAQPRQGARYHTLFFGDEVHDAL
jgi:autoinducer 2-degrading protein